MNDVRILGCGMVGSAMAKDLSASGYGVKVFDLSEKNLERVAGLPGVETARLDLSVPGAASRVVEGADAAVNAVPGWMGLSILEQSIRAGVDMVDISFMPEDPGHLDALARKRGVRCIVDMGVAPGLSHMLFGRALAELKGFHRFICRVGGLPVERRLPWQYLAPFSPVDVLEEYTRPARIVRDGNVVTVPALSEPERVEVPGVGTLEDSLTDGLRSLLRFHDRVPRMEERTLRYPGHRDAVLLLRDTGLLSRDSVTLPGGTAVAPMDLTSLLLTRTWAMHAEDPDITVMLVNAEGAEGDLNWVLFDRFCPDTRVSSMARTTGYTCTAGVDLLLSGTLKQPGVHYPEDLGARRECYEQVTRHLEQRGVRLKSL